MCCDRSLLVGSRLLGTAHVKGVVPNTECVGCGGGIVGVSRLGRPKISTAQTMVMSEHVVQTCELASQSHRLKTQIWHNIGLQAPISMRID